jgi:hypothetical protein
LLRPRPRLPLSQWLEANIKQPPTVTALPERLQL